MKLSRSIGNLESKSKSRKDVYCSSVSRIESRSNNLNAMRLLFAAMVMVTHAFAVSYGTVEGEPVKLLTRGQETCGTLAVDMFFLISGMLVTASWFRSRSMNDFILRRVLRIYPGFIVALIFSGLLVWSVTPEFRHSIGNGLGWIRSMISDAASLGTRSTDRPQAFADNPWPGRSNGSLWTIRREFECYMVVAVTGLFFLFKRRYWLLTATASVGAWYIWQLSHTKPNWGHLQVNPIEGHPSRLLAYFLVGMLAWLFRDKIRFNPLLAIAGLVLLLISVRVPPVFSILFLPIGSYVVLYIGLSRPFRLTRWTEKTDISYGVYLYAWPIQQLVATLPEMRTIALNLLVSIPFTAFLAFLSWRLVEQRFLKLKAARMIDYDPASEEFEASVGEPARAI